MINKTILNINLIRFSLVDLVLYIYQHTEPYNTVPSSDDYFSYKTVIKDNQIDLILYVAPADEEPNVKLFKAIVRAKEESKDEKAKSKTRQYCYSVYTVTVCLDIIIYQILFRSSSLSGHD